LGTFPADTFEPAGRSAWVEGREALAVELPVAAVDGEV